MKTQAEDIYDEMLVLRCQDGDASALPILINRWQERLLRHARIVSGRNDSARDILQESWIAVFKGLSRLRDPSRFKYWAYRIVNNKCIDHSRKQQHRDQQDHEVDLDQLHAEATNSDIEAQVQTLLKSLPEAQRAVMALHYLQGFDLNEIAQITQLPLGTVKSRLFHGRERFKQILNT